MAKKNLSLESLFSVQKNDESNQGNTATIRNLDIVETKGKKNTFVINEEVQIRFNNYVKRSGTKKAVIVNQALIEYLERREG